MQKLRQSKRLRLLRLLLPFISGIFMWGCAKIDTQHAEEINNATNSKDFFYTPANTDANVLKVIENIKARNSKAEFVSKFGEQFGYPVWNKVLETHVKHTSGNISSFGGGSAAVSYDTIIIIPFALNNQPTVNGFIKAVVNDSISLSFSLARDYYAYGFAANNTESPATHFAFLMMELNKTVFGTMEYIITDHRLFSPDTITTKPSKLVFGNTTTQNNFFTTYCSPVTVTFPYCGSNICHSIGHCIDVDNCPQSLCYTYEVTSTT
jgi:hypothetical protein